MDEWRFNSLKWEMDHYRFNARSSLTMAIASALAFIIMVSVFVVTVVVGGDMHVAIFSGFMSLLYGVAWVRITLNWRQYSKTYKAKKNQLDNEQSYRMMTGHID